MKLFIKRINSAFVFAVLLGVGSLCFARGASAAPVIDGWTADPGPSLVTDGDESVLHLQAHNDGLYITCDISSPTGDTIVGRVDMSGSTNISLNNVGGGVYRFYRTVGVSPAVLNEWVRVRPSGGSTGQAHYSVTCRGGLNGTGAAASNAPQDVLVRVEGWVSIDPAVSDSVYEIPDYSCDIISRFHSTKPIHNCGFDSGTSPRDICYNYPNLPCQSRYEVLPVDSNTAAFFIWGYFPGSTRSVQITCDGLYGKVTASTSGVVCPAPAVSGVCGSSNGGTFPSAPTTGLCSSGSASAVNGSGPWFWTCTADTMVSCSANKTSVTNASCGSNAAQYLSTASGWPDTSSIAFCASGTLSGGTPTFPNAGLSTSWTCLGSSNGGTNASCSASRWSVLGTPTNLQAVCDSAGTNVTLSWGAVSTATTYPLRVSNESDSLAWTGTCSSVNPDDTCQNVSTTSFTRSVIPENNYRAWVYAYRSGDGRWSPAVAVNFQCHAPVVTVSGHITNKTTGAGIKDVSFSTTCGSPSNPLPGLTDSSGYYSFVVPYDGAFCIHPNTPSGMQSNPIASSLPLSQQGQHTYEYQKAGVAAGDHPGCDSYNPATGLPSGCDNWKKWDLASDSGYNFEYTPLPPSLVVCPAPPVSIALGQTRSDFKAWYRPSSATAVTCNNLTGTDQNVTNSANWSSAEPSKVEVVGKGSLRGVDTTPTGSYVTVTAAYNSMSATTSVEVVCTPDPTCGGVRADTCTDDKCLDSCGQQYDGEKDCRDHWQEVAP